MGNFSCILKGKYKGLVEVNKRCSDENFFYIKKVPDYNWMSGGFGKEDRI